MENATSPDINYTAADYTTNEPKWCVGCGDYGILNSLRNFLASENLDPAKVVNISGIGCSGRTPHYLNTYGIHSLHGRAIPIALGVALTRPDLSIFIQSGDGDAMSIGGNHLIYGLEKNFNCVFMLMDNRIYALTKGQTSPTSKNGTRTTTHPYGSHITPINPVSFALGLGGSFVARTADWLPHHLEATLRAAYHHQGFSFVHIAQRCPKFSPEGWDFKNKDHFQFLFHEDGIPVDEKSGAMYGKVVHDPKEQLGCSQLLASKVVYLGLFYQNRKKVIYEQATHRLIENTPGRDRDTLFEHAMML